LAWELKQAGLNWRAAFLGRCLTGTALAVAKLRADLTFTSEAARAQAFVAAGLGCRATYFNLAKKLQAHEAAPVLKLVRTEPPAPATADQNYLDMLRRRFGHLGNG
jgi:hypothetical protein